MERLKPRHLFYRGFTNIDTSDQEEGSLGPKGSQRASIACQKAP
jgi:hypothetical protein